MPAATAAARGHQATPARRFARVEPGGSLGDGEPLARAALDARRRGSARGEMWLERTDRPTSQAQLRHAWHGAAAGSVRRALLLEAARQGRGERAARFEGSVTLRLEEIEFLGLQAAC
ncbi:unnamed protein product [Prorocentrum cordatum]|uniref:Uncharacterized protein n=1 Tax=Prorocentrum cordatum TaxID=2364126 RepID=A0ABN9VYS1_9DINO|nr:unnamed protein product [Polarella glacialis]